MGIMFQKTYLPPKILTDELAYRCMYLLLLRLSTTNNKIWPVPSNLETSSFFTHHLCSPPGPSDRLDLSDLCTNKIMGRIFQEIWLSRPSWNMRRNHIFFLSLQKCECFRHGSKKIFPFWNENSNLSMIK